MYEKLEELRKIKAGFKDKKPVQFGDPKNLNYHAIIGSMPSSISFGDLMKYHNYVREMAGKRA